MGALKIIAAIGLIAGAVNTPNTWAQNFSWVRNCGRQAQAVATDAANNVFVAGQYSGVTTIGGSPALPAHGGQDGFVAKYDSTGAVVWARAFGGSGDDTAGAIATDAAGNVYVSGSFVGPSLRFTANDSLVQGGTSSLFLAKYDAGGAFQWACRGVSFGQFDVATASALRVDASGNIILGGSFASVISFAGVGGTGSIMVSGGMQSLFLYKFSPAGTLLWGKPGLTNAPCALNAISTNTAGSIFITGKVSAPVSWGAGSQTTPAGDQLFVAKLTSAGTLEWMQHEGKSQAISSAANMFDCGNAIAVDASDNVYVGGSLLDSAWTIQVQGLMSRQWGVVLKYGSTGTRLWIRRMGGSSAATVVNGLALDAAGNPYITGTYKDTMSISGTAFPPSYANDIFVARLTPGGDVTWLNTASGNNHDAGAGIALDANGGVVSVGLYRQAADFGTIPMVGASTGTDGYVARLANTATSGIDAVNADEALFDLWPNPVREEVCLSNPFQSTARVWLTDVGGRTWLAGEVSALGSSTLDVRSIAPGMYTVAICTQADGCRMQRLVKE